MLDKAYFWSTISSTMATSQIKKIEKIANESAKYARHALRKSSELQTLLSLMDYKSGRVIGHTSVEQIFRRLKI